MASGFLFQKLEICFTMRKWVLPNNQVKQAQVFLRKNIQILLK